MPSFKVSDETVNSYGIRVLSSGGDFSQFEKNPIMLYDHDDYKHLPIGTWENLKVHENADITADPIFDEEDSFALSIKKKVDKGIIKMSSIGIIPLEWSDDPEMMIPGQIGVTVTKWLLREISVCPFGSNKNAFKLYDKLGNEINLNENTTFFNSNTKTEMSDSKDNLRVMLTAGLNLSESTSDSEMLRHVLNLSTENTSLKQKLEALEKEKIDAEKELKLKAKTDYLKLAFNQKIITAEQMKVYNNDKYEIDDLKVILGDLKPTINLSEVPGSNKTGKGPWETRMDEIQKQ